MDFVEGLPKSCGYSVIMVVVDRFTKYSHFVPLKHPYTAASVAQLFLQNIVKLHSMPYTITSDRDRSTGEAVDGGRPSNARFLVRNTTVLTSLPTAYPAPPCLLRCKAGDDAA